MRQRRLRILFATDGSPGARDAALLVTSYFDPARVRINVLTVGNEHHENVWWNAGSAAWKDLEIPPLHPDEVAHEAAERFEDVLIEAEYRWTTGDPAVEILRIADSLPYDMIVMGGHRESWLGNALLGSVSLHVLHHAHASVLIAHHAPTGSGKVLLATDGSAGGERARRLAASVLNAASVSVEVAGVVAAPQVPIVVPSAGGVLLGRVADRTELRRSNELAREGIERAAAALRERGFGTTTALLTGTPGTQLLKEAENIAADLVVVGSRGLGPFRRAVLGSVSDQVVRHAPATLVARDPYTPKGH